MWAIKNILYYSTTIKIILFRILKYSLNFLSTMISLSTLIISFNFPISNMIVINIPGSHNHYRDEKENLLSSWFSLVTLDTDFWEFV